MRPLGIAPRLAASPPSRRARGRPSGGSLPGASSSVNLPWQVVSKPEGAGEWSDDRHDGPQAPPHRPPRHTSSPEPTPGGLDAHLNAPRRAGTGPIAPIGGDRGGVVVVLSLS